MSVTPPPTVDLPATLGDALVAARRAVAAGDPGTAEALARAIAAQAPTLPEPYALLGDLALASGRPDLARLLFDEALRHAAGGVEFQRGAARAAKAAGDDATAVQHWRAAVLLDPSAVSNWVDLAVSLHDVGDFAAAEQAARYALRLAPDNAQSWLTMAFCRLLAGDWTQGFAAYEWRWHDHALAGQPRPTLPRLRSLVDLQNKRLLILAEQGHGDSLQCLRFVPWLIDQGATVVVALPVPLLRLTARIPGLAVVDLDAIETGRAPWPHADFWTPAMALPGLCGATPSAIPGAVPYLTADPDLAARWRGRLQPDGRPLVGLIWAGNPAFVADRRRSPHLAPLQPVLSVPGIRFVALQMGAARGELATVADGSTVIDLGGEIGDFADTAAIMANLDLVISSCTAPAHLAGAIGRPLWLMLPHVPDWRWLATGDRTAWYPSARLYRQPRAGDWGTVGDRLAADLARYATATGFGRDLG